MLRRRSATPEPPVSGPALARAAALTAFVGAALALAGTDASAQRVSDPVLNDPLVPGGRVRLEFTPSFSTWDTRFGLRGGEDVEEPLAQDLTDEGDGSTLFPGLATLRESLQALANQPDYQARLGSSSGVVTRDVTRIDLGLSLGLFDRLTLGVTVPWVKTRAAVDVAFTPDPSSDLGLNPASTDPDAVAALLEALELAAAAADAQASSVCAAAEGPECDAARALSSRAGAFHTLTRSAYQASPFFPVGGGAMAQRLQAALASLNASLTSAGLPTVGATMEFAGEAFGEADFARLPRDPSIQGAPLQTVEGLWELGDVEIGGTARLLEGEVRDSGAASPRFAWMLTGGALVRLATGQVDNPHVAFDVGSGDGQMDYEGRVDAALRVGAHFDVRGSFRYGIQESTTLLRRVAPHEDVFAPASTLRAVRWTPGDYRSIALSPRWHLGEALSLAVDVWRFEKDPDAFELTAPEPDDVVRSVDTAALEQESGLTANQVAVGLRYSTVALGRRGIATMPLEVGVRVVRTLSGSGGNVPKATRAELSISLLRRLWGRP